MKRRVAVVLVVLATTSFAVWHGYSTGTLPPFLWFGSGHGCVHDMNGDGTPDLVGISEIPLVPGAWVRAIDGASGRTRWSAWVDGDLVTGGLFCAGGDTVMAVFPRFRVRVFDWKTGAPRWERTLPDEAKSASAGPGCLKITLGADESANVDSASGADREACDAVPPPAPWRRETTLHWRNLRVEETERGSRTELTAFDDSKSTGGPVWTTLVGVKRSFVQGVSTALPAGIFVAGTRSGSPFGEEEIAWSLVRPDGLVAYQNAVRADVLWESEVTDTVAFLHYGHALAAVDVATGEIRWESGFRTIPQHSDSNE